MDSPSSENKKLQIAFLTNSIGFGGAEKVLAFVANGLARRGYSVIIINYDSFSNFINKKRQLFDDRIRVYTYDGKPFIIHRWREILFTIKVLIKTRVDITVGFTTFPNYVGTLVKILYGIPSIMSERGDPNITINKKNLPSLWELLIINHASGAIFQLKDASLFYGKRLREKSIVIPNPAIITYPTLGAPSYRKKTVVSVGRFCNTQKRYDVMIKAFSLFSNVHQDYLLKLYGAGPDEKLIRDWAKENGIEDKVLFMGVSENPVKDIRDDGMFLITSDFEGISNSLLEAMAIGLPCVSTDSTPGGARMLIHHERNGLLVPVRDPQAIADALCRFAEDSTFANECGKKASEVLIDYAPETILDRWEGYIKLVAKR